MNFSQKVLCYWRRNLIDASYRGYQKISQGAFGKLVNILWANFSRKMNKGEEEKKRICCHSVFCGWLEYFYYIYGLILAITMSQVPKYYGTLFSANVPLFFQTKFVKHSELKLVNPPFFNGNFSCSGLCCCAGLPLASDVMGFYTM